MRQPAAIQQVADPQGTYLPFTASGGTNSAASDSQSAKTEKAAEKPADQATDKKPAEAKKEEEKKDEEKKDEAKSDEPEAFKFFKGPWFTETHIDVRGWLDQGFTWNPSNPSNGFNETGGLRRPRKRVQFDRYYLIVASHDEVEKIAGRRTGAAASICSMARTPAYTAEATGLDTSWNSGRFYGPGHAAGYVDLAINQWIFRGGHFLAPCGYESVMAPGKLLLLA